MPEPLAPRLAAIAFLAAALIYALMASGLLHGLDAAGLALLRLDPASPLWAQEALRDLTALGSYTVLGLFVACVTAWLAAWGPLRLSGLFLASSLGATLLSNLIKQGVARARPETGEALAITFSPSFPSGHALLTAAILLSALGLATLRTSQPGARRLAWGLAGAIVVLVGLSRIALGVHWPSDVLAGWCIGVGWALMMLHLARRMIGTGNPQR